MCSLEENSLNFVYLVYLASVFEQYLSSGRLPALVFFFHTWDCTMCGHGEITCSHEHWSSPDSTEQIWLIKELISD